jgi:hypothetical protein
MVSDPMTKACVTGLLYFSAVFTFAFAMGVARQLVIAPRLGPLAAVLLEVPILVVASWIVARRLLRYRSLTVLERTVMGATAFALTMVGEAALSVIMRGQSVADWAAAVATPLGLVGLTAQLVFAAIPIFVNDRIDAAPTV